MMIDFTGDQLEVVLVVGMYWQEEHTIGIKAGGSRGCQGTGLNGCCYMSLMTERKETAEIKQGAENQM